MNTALIGLGANIGNPLQQLQDAYSALSALTESTVKGVSSIYGSSPMGPQDQPGFFNACVLLETLKPPETLLHALQTIEHQQGRQRLRRWGERCIDLDLLLYNDVRIKTAALEVPHPGITERDFVLQPLIDLLGANWRLPSGASLSDQLAKVSHHGLVKVDQALDRSGPP